jgi:hypothetical protein
MHKSSDELKRELAAARQQVKVGGIYAHYKQPANTYKVLDVAVEEATDEVCVIYQAQYGDKLVFTRPLKSWLESVDKDGARVERFSQIA